MCKGCGQPTRALSGYCSKTANCRRLGSTARQKKSREAVGPELYAYLNEANQVIYIGENTTADRHMRAARLNEWMLREVALIRIHPAPADKSERRRLEGELIHKAGHPKYNDRCDRPGGCGWSRENWRAGPNTVVLPPIVQVSSLNELIGGYLGRTSQPR